MMRISDLAELRQPRPYPAVSILAPLQPHRPGNLEDPIVLRDLLDRARGRLQEELGARDSAEVIRRLEEAIASVDLHRPPDGVAVFAAPGETHLLALPFTVPARVEVDQTFATRDLVRGMSRAQRYRVLALGEKPTRLLEGVGTHLTEVDGDFPLFAEGARGEPLASGGYTTHTARSDAQRLSFFRQVDQALDAAARDDPLPLVVAGPERDLASFDEVTTHRSWVVGTVHGSYEDATPHDLAARVLPIVDAHLASQRAQVAAELVEAVGTGHGIVGVKPAWDAALAGRVRLLLVEDDFEYPARVVDGHLEPAGDPEVSGVIDDAVDELVEIVLDAGGDILVYEPGELAEHGPVAVVLRY